MKKYILLIILIFNFQYIFAQSGWVWQNPLPQGNNLKSLRVIDNNNVAAVGECGVFIKSTNAGVNWTLNKLQDTLNFNSVFFVNNSTGWIAGGLYSPPYMLNSILKTTNGGNNWFYQNSGITDNELNALYFTDPLTGYAAGGNFSSGKMIKTTDGGSSWFDLNMSIDRELVSVYFLNSTTGFTGASNRIARTTDGGNTWTISTIAGTIVSIKFTDTLYGYAAKGSGIAFNTTNGGLSWNTMNVNGSSIEFADQNTGWMTGPINPSRIFKTTNSGINWLTYNFQTEEQINTIGFYDINKGWCAGGYGAIQQTTDGGMTWNNGLSGYTQSAINDACFLNSQTGYAVGGTNYLGYLYATTNGGINWSERSLNPTFFNSVCFINETTGWVCGYGFSSNILGKILKTTDGGVTWDLNYSILIEKYTSVKFFDENTGFVTGYNTLGLGGRIMKTTNSGLNWSSTYLGGQSGIFQSHFLNVNTGWVCSINSSVYRTTNSGINWVSVSSGLSGEIHSVYFLNINTGWAGTLYGDLYATTNGGVSWFNQYHMSYFITDIEFANDQLGWITSSTGQLAYTTNTGTNWKVYPRFTFNGLGKLTFLSADTGWVFGMKGLILKTTNGGGLVSLHNDQEIIPNQYFLSQNFPNPFNPVTDIKFNIPVGNGRDRSVKLIIYDLLGKEIATLINQQMQPGSYSVDWDASNYPSGVYFYKLETEGFIESKKMILLK